VLIIDFGSQVTQLIARRVRESGVYCEIHPFDKAEQVVDDFAPQGGDPLRRPFQRHRGRQPADRTKVFELGVPVLGVCYGEQLMCDLLGGRVEAAITVSSAGRDRRSRGEPRCSRHRRGGPREPVWMSHGDRVVAIPAGFEPIATSVGAPFAAIADESAASTACSSIPEVAHTPQGSALLRNFTHGVAGLAGDWTMAAFKDEAIARIRAQVGKGRRDLRPLGRSRSLGRRRC
jgi:GMP synthase (glutamine-hydrolysing)